MATVAPHRLPNTQVRPRAIRAVVPAGRVLFALIFVMAAPGHFTSAEIQYAAAHGVPLASILVPLAGVLALAGGLSVMLGWKARIGALLLIVFLVPVTLSMHAFWTATDAQTAMVQRVMFLKNVSILGGALVLLYFGAGPISFDARPARASRSAPLRSVAPK